MQEEKYQEFLKTAPTDHFSNEFVEFLRNNNEVVEFYDGWLVVKNIKYGGDWLTAFYVDWRFEGEDFNRTSALTNCWKLLKNYGDREWLIKAPHKRSVKLFHVHMYKKK